MNVGAKPSSANVGAAGEVLVAARLLSLGVDVAKPYSDNGADLIAFAPDFSRAVPIQVKTASTPRIAFERQWFSIPGIVLVFVWLCDGRGRFFVYDGIGDAEAFLGTSADTKSWTVDGRYHVTPSGLGATHMERLKSYEDAWGKITGKLAD